MWMRMRREDGIGGGEERLLNTDFGMEVGMEIEMGLFVGVEG